jgi:hypothetical protein
MVPLLANLVSLWRACVFEQCKESMPPAEVFDYAIFKHELTEFEENFTKGRSTASIDL